jgi:hypothetical protein
MRPSGKRTVMLRLFTGVPRARRDTTSSSIACMIFGTPASTKTFSIWNPGAVETGFLIKLAPFGTRAMRWRRSLNSPGA